MSEAAVHLSAGPAAFPVRDSPAPVWLHSLASSWTLSSQVVTLDHLHSHEIRCAIFLRTLSALSSLNSRLQSRHALSFSYDLGKFRILSQQLARLVSEAVLLQ